jgi:hypothetical protein
VAEVRAMRNPRRQRDFGVLIAAIVGAAKVESGHNSTQAEAPGDLAETEGFLASRSDLDGRGDLR